MIYTAIKPNGTFYSDYTIQNGFLYAIFEHDSRVTNKKLCRTDKTNADWKSFEVTETETELIINLGEEVDTLPSCSDYTNFLGRIIKKLNISQQEARNKYGLYSVNQWETLLNS